MDLSSLEIRVLSLIVENIPEFHELRRQVQVVRVSKRDYTGCGVYTDFELPKGTVQFEPHRWRIEDMPKIEGIHPDLPSGAGFILWFKNGFITCLEGYTYEGDWPTNEELFSLSA